MHLFTFGIHVGSGKGNSIYLFTIFDYDLGSLPEGCTAHLQAGRTFYYTHSVPNGAVDF